jgi:DNA primase
MKVLAARLSVMIRFTEPDTYLLTESKERPAKQSNREYKKRASSVFVPHLEERAHKSLDEEQGRADPTG